MTNSDLPTRPQTAWPWLLALFLSIGLAFAPVSLGLYSMKFDIMDQFYPCRVFIAESFARGELPLWSPYIYLGYPFYSDPQAGLHYPLTWLLALLFGYRAYTMHLEFLFHVWLLAASFWALLRSLGLRADTAFWGALSLGLSGFVLSNAQHLTWLISVAWLSTAAWALHRLWAQPRVFWALVLGWSLAMNLTGGYPAFSIIAFYLLLPYCLWRFWHLEGGLRLRYLGLFSLAALFSLSLGWSYLYGLYEVLPLVDRGAGLTAEQVNALPFPPKALISLFAPWATGTAPEYWGTDISMSNLYLGALALPLALYSGRLGLKRSAYWPLALGLVLLLVAMGSATPLRTWLYHALPGMKFFKMASIFRLFASFFFLIFLSFALEQLLQSAEKRRAFGRFLALYLPLYFGFYLLLPQLANFPPEVWGRIGPQGLWYGLILAGLALGLWAFHQKTWQTWLLLAFTLGDLSVAAFLHGPSTVYDRQVRLSQLQGAIDQLKAERELPLLPVDAYPSGGDGRTVPIWQNISFFRAIPAASGFNNYHLGLSDRIEPALYAQPLVHALDKGLRVELKTFEGQRISAQYRAEARGRVRLLQIGLPHWQVMDA